MVRVIRILLAHKRENYIIGIKVARWRKGLIALEFHPFAQMEGIDLAVFAHLPAPARLGTSSVVPGLKSTSRL